MTHHPMQNKAVNPDRAPGTWILLRGWTRESGHWGAFQPLLAARLAPAAVVALDLPGAGPRWREASPTRIAAITDDMCRQAAGLAPPWYLLGLSMGGMVALDWARRHPGSLAGVLLVNSSLRGIGRFTERLRPTAWPGLARVLLARHRLAAEAQILRLTSARPADHAARVPEWAALWRQHPMSHRQALRQLLAAARFSAPPGPPRVPLRVLCSAGDGLVDPACSRRLAAAWQLPWAEHPHAGHDLPLDAPQWVADQAALLAAAGEPAAR